MTNTVNRSPEEWSKYILGTFLSDLDISMHQFKLLKRMRAPLAREIERLALEAGTNRSSVESSHSRYSTTQKKEILNNG